MPYRFLEDIATADVAFEAWGKSPEEMFAAAADAVMKVMIADLRTIRAKEELELRLEHEELDMLLFNFLNEFIYYKDARLLLLRVKSVTIEEANARFLLRTVLRGEQLDPLRHNQLVDVKAVTLHRFHVEKTEAGWRTEVVLDI